MFSNLCASQGLILLIANGFIQVIAEVRKYQRILDDLILGAGYEVSRVGDGHLILFPDLEKGITLLLELRDNLRKEKMLILNGKSLEIRIALHCTPIGDLSFTAIQGTLKHLSKMESEAIPMHVCISDTVTTKLKNLQLSQIAISEVEGKQGNIMVAHRRSEKIKIKNA